MPNVHLLFFKIAIPIQSIESKEEEGTVVTVSNSAVLYKRLLWLLCLCFGDYSVFCAGHV